MMSAKGKLLLIVGPSGAGKDILIDGLRSAIREDDGFVFPGSLSIGTPTT